MLRKNAISVREKVKAPPLRQGPGVYDHSLTLGETTNSGAALMVELISEERVVGHICTSLVNRREIEEHHIARIRDL